MSNIGISNENRSQFLSDYNRYLGLLFLQDFNMVEEEEKMRRHLDEILATQPKLIKNPDGTVSVRDLFRKVENSKKPK